MNFTAKQIADVLDGYVDGNESVTANHLAKIEEGKQGAISFLANPKYNEYLYTTNASIVIINKDFQLSRPIHTTLIRVDDAYKGFTKLLEFYNQVKLNKTGIETPSFVSESAQYGDNLYLGSFSYLGNNTKIGSDVKIYPNTYIGDNVVIGDNTIIFSGVKIYSETQIGNHVIIHSGTVIGADGFGFAKNEDNTYTKVPQIGNVCIEDHVEIGASCTIDRATLGSTIIKKGVKLDNQIQIAHNVEVGENTVIASQTGIAGSTKIGQNCIIGGQVGIVGHISIGNNVKIQAQSGVGRSIKDNEVIQGSPAINYSDFSKSFIYFKNFPKIVKEIEELKKKIN